MPLQTRSEGGCGPVPASVATTALQFFGWTSLLAMQEALATLVITPGTVSVEMSLDDVSRSWIVCIDGRRCVVVERIECHRHTPAETYDLWEEYEE